MSRCLCFLSVDSFSSTLLGRLFDVKYFPILTCGQNFLFSISQIKAFGSLWSLLHPGAKPRGQHIACMLPACSKHVACMLLACYQLQKLFCLHATSMFFTCQHNESMLKVCYQHVARMLPACCQHVANMLPACCQHVASILPACCQHVTSMLLACCQHVTSMFQHVARMLQ